jgi:hypothetical protein
MRLVCGLCSSTVPARIAGTVEQRRVDLVKAGDTAILTYKPTHVDQNESGDY